MITVLIRRVIPVLGVGVFFGFVVRMAHLPPPVGDLWFHLRIGNEFLDGWSIADPGHLGVFDSAQWAPTQWLSQIALTQIEHSYGLGGVLWVTGMIQIAIVLCIYLMCRESAGALPAAIATLACLACLAGSFTARPQVLSYLFVTLMVWAWMRSAHDGKPRFWLIPLVWLWVPLHGMWPIGIVISAVLALALMLDRRPGGRCLCAWLAVPILSGLAALATPLGWHAYSAVAAVSSRSQYFSEWGRPDFTDPRVMALVVMIAAVLVVELRRGPLTWFRLLLLGTGILLAIYSTRTVPVAAIVLVPLVADAIESLVPATPRVGRVEYVALAAMVAIALMTLTIVAPERGREEVAAPWLDDRLAQEPDGTRVLNGWDAGAYFLWRHPQLDLVMHGYGDVFTDDELRRNVDISLARPRWDELVEGLDADIAVVVPETTLAYALTTHAGWTVTEGDDDFLLLEPPAGS